MGFKIDFDIKDYKDILPEFPTDERELINYQYYGKPDECIWRNEKPKIITEKYKEQEITRILRTGAWMILKDTPIWLPPNHYFALKYGKAGPDNLEFRLKRLKHVYHKIRARNNPYCIGTLTIKNRADGETTNAITDGFHECLDGMMETGMIGIQSKTRNDAINPCWRTLQTLWLNLDQWLKDELCSDMVSGKEIAQKMQFMRAATGDKAARNIVLEYFPAVFNAMDGKHNMRKCILDEICKWVECEFYDTFTNYKKFILPGMERRGMFDMFSSPADQDNKSNKQVFELWKLSDPTQLTEQGSTTSRIHRYYSNPLDGIQGAYDKWGDADPQYIYEHIMRERAATPKDKLLAEVRGMPLNEEEMFGAFEGGNLWDNAQGIRERKIYLLGTRFKNEQTKEPVKVFGNLEWKEGVIDHPEGVVFRMADRNEFDVVEGRFCFSTLPQNPEPLEMKFNHNVQDLRVVPPKYIENCLGIDPYGKRYPGKRFSNGAGVNWKFRDVLQTGIFKQPTMTYCNRPFHENIFFEDMLKAAIFNRAMVQFENANDKIAGYFEDRGYHSWLLASFGEKQGSLKTGDAPGRGSFLDEGIGLLNALTNLPAPNSDERYHLQHNWHYELLECMLNLNPKDTHENDLTMAWIQAVIGAVKITFKKKRQTSSIGNEIVDYIAGTIY